MEVVTIEEAIRLLVEWAEQCRYEAIRKAVGLAVAALRAQPLGGEAAPGLSRAERGPWQEPVKLDRSRWEGCGCCNRRRCKTCKNAHAAGMPCATCYDHSRYKAEPYCPTCGRPLTEEAWAELERRINDEKTDNGSSGRKF